MIQNLGTPQELMESIAQVHRRIAPDCEWIPWLGLSRHVSLELLREWMAPWLDLGFHKVLDLCCAGLSPVDARIDRASGQ